MKLVQGSLDLSASDISSAFSCSHRTALDLSLARGERPPPSYFDPMTAALRARGFEHERRYVDALRARGLEVVDLDHLRGEQAVAATVVAMKEGAQAIVQASLRWGPWNGRADVLLRVEEQSALGAWSYEPVDTKLARETRAASVLQLALYAELLAQDLGALPQRFCVVAPSDDADSFREEWLRVRDHHAYFRMVRSALSDATNRATDALLATTYPEPVEHCEVCRWWETCDKRRRADDHLSLVAGISRSQRRELVDHRVPPVTTLAQLAQMPLPFKPRRGTEESFQRVREQARVQWLARMQKRPVFELLPVDPTQGLATLPMPCEGDVFLDLEGNPFGGDGGREYLFGIAHVTAAGTLIYERVWAKSPAEERAAFEWLIDLLLARWRGHTGMHVYHYAPYEPSALKHLMGRFATREDEMDRLLRANRFVDLYRIAKNSVRAGVERYSIKDLEVFYQFQREVNLRKASVALRSVEQALELGAFDVLETEVLEIVEGYNREDCLSALRLRDWLETLRHGLEASGAVLPRPPESDGAASDAVEAARTEAQHVADLLLKGVPENSGERTEEQQARWLLAHMLEFHRREDKSGWWEFFRLSALTDEELRDERAALAGLTFENRLGGTKKCPVDRYRFVAQDYDVREGKTLKLPGGEELGTVHALDRAARTIDVKKKNAHSDTHPTAVFVHELIRSKPLPDSLLGLAKWVVEHGIDAPGLHRAARNLLLRRPPRLAGDVFLRQAEEETLAFARRVVVQLDHAVLPIQGPPGAGKTFTAAHMICELVAAGKTVGVTAVSHKVIHKLLDGAIALGKERGVAIRALAKVTEKSETPQDFEETADNKRVPEAIHGHEANLIGGTAWLWAHEGCADVLDVLFVDEAGQMSLANVLAVAQAARSIVLVGDTQQLEQPLQGSHPDGVAISALLHLLGTHKTVPEDAGIFLAETWRLAPDICDFTSELFYEGRLLPRPDLEAQEVRGTEGLDGAGLWYAACEHDGCQDSSEQEVDLIAKLVDRLLTPGATWRDRHGASRSLIGSDVLIVVPYNAQVSLLSERLAPRGVRIGTVDKFQGQEAPIVIYGMTTSTPQDAPRGMNFLYSPNRLNVATSRAQCACIMVATEALFEPECRTVRHVQLANAFCRYVELARLVE